MPEAALALPEPFYPLHQQIAIDLPGARAVFTTRRGGVSKPPYDTLNCGILTDDDPVAVRTNRDWLAQQFGVKFAWRKQVHAAEVHVVSAANGTDALPADGDGVATATRDVAPLVLAADCLPIAITTPGAVAMVHAGWQGLAQGVIAAGVGAVRALRPGEDPQLTAAIGPAAGVCCYEVGQDLIERFTQLGYGENHRGRHLDLKAIARQQLRQAGVQTVHEVALCTICADPGLLFSHRRDHGTTGRQAGIAWLT
jgi:polyphenol oxidase